jgi:hypothetical protein
MVDARGAEDHLGYEPLGGLLSVSPSEIRLCLLNLCSCRGAIYCAFLAKFHKITPSGLYTLESMILWDWYAITTGI